MMYLVANCLDATSLLLLLQALVPHNIEKIIGIHEFIMVRLVLEIDICAYISVISYM